MEKIRQLIMSKWDVRRTISHNFEGIILPHIMKKSKEKWKLTGIPCKHAIAFITSLREPLEKYVDLCYLTQKFRVAYETLIPATPDKNQWPEFDHGFFMYPPLLKSTAGRRHDERFKGSGHGSSQLELLSIEYPVLSFGQTIPPPATSVATEEKKEGRKEE
ncbi:hypothetical protein U9M48_019766 [Paspalum notatum var. saurae]|uniref:Zinc finger PMZ-type domain-containing protein n=1 Tax=Paspalum notatum var. saurae TaxID=547442 RepID=A0AAQ3TDR2_PASNO